LPNHSGVYLLTFEYQSGYIVYAAGLTRRWFRRRFSEHTRRYLSGDYTILDVAQANLGLRAEVWHGWGWTPAKRAAFAERRTDIEAAARRQLAEFRVFVTEVDLPERTPERLEAAIMNSLYAQAAPLPDPGMQLSPRRNGEAPIFVVNACAEKLHGLPDRLGI
jgi:hypothetical protein